MKYLSIPHHVLELLFAIVAAFGAGLLWPRGRYRSLAVFLLFQSALMLINVSEESRGGGLFLVSPVFTLAKGPLLYLFIRAMVNDTALRRWRLYRHFLPMLLALPLTIDPQFVIVLGSVSQVGYLAASFRLLHRYHRMARTFRSDADELTLAWVVNAFGLFAAQALIGLVRLNLQARLSPLTGEIWFSFDLAFLFGLCCFMLVKALKQPRLYDDMLVYEQEAGRPADRSGQEADAEAPGIFATLEAVILGKGLYRQPRLTVEDIARETRRQMKEISWAINRGSGQNFNEYINRLRVNDVKQQLLSGQAGSKSVLELAFAAGFNSKSTFNAAFKREVGMTPTEFIRTLPPPTASG